MPPSTPFDMISAAPEDFGPHTGEPFTVQTEAGPLTLILDNVKRFERSMIRDKVVRIEGEALPPRQAFALTFEGPVTPVLASAMVTLQHATLGDLTLFLSPFRQDEDCVLYEALFN